MILTVREVLRETRDVVTLRFDRPEGFGFVAGQYCLVSLPDDPRFADAGKPITFSSSPDAPYLDLTVKGIGPFTGELCSCRPGARVAVNGPRGEALTFDGSTGDDVVMLAGGSGITPFMSILRFARDRRLPNRFLLLDACRTEEDIIFRRELDRMPEPIRVVYFLDSAGEGWTGERGFITREKVEEHAGGMRDCLWYLCGPPPMTRSVREILDRMGIPPDRRRFDLWEIPGKSPA